MNAAKVEVGGSGCSVGTTLHSHIICQQNKSSNEIHLASTRAWEASIICCRLLYIQHMNTTAMPRLHVYLTTCDALGMSAWHA